MFDLGRRFTGGVLHRSGEGELRRGRTPLWSDAPTGSSLSCATLTHMTASPREEPSSVGIRALQQHASAVVARAAAGERIVVTDRGRPTAMLVPMPADGLDGLIAAGLARPARRPASAIAPPAPAGPGDRPLSEVVAELRADERD